MRSAAVDMADFMVSVGFIDEAPELDPIFDDQLCEGVG